MNRASSYLSRAIISGCLQNQEDNSVSVNIIFILCWLFIQPQILRKFVCVCVCKKLFMLSCDLQGSTSRLGQHPTTLFSEARKIRISCNWDWPPPFSQESYWTIQDTISCSCCLLHAFLYKKEQETHPSHSITSSTHILTPSTSSLRASWPELLSRLPLAADPCKSAFSLTVSCQLAAPRHQHFGHSLGTLRFTWNGKKGGNEIPH